MKTQLMFGAALSIALVARTSGAGACCLPGGICEETFDGAVCEAFGGVYQGDGTVCTQELCPITGACCLTTGFCATLTDDECDSIGGGFQGAESICVEVDCPGACCLSDGDCLVLSRSGCEEICGYYGGFGLDCGTCTGVCCLPDGTCDELTVEACIATGGAYQGSGTSCAQTGICVGACCFDDGSCDERPIDECLTLGGGFQGAGSGCAAMPDCDGACCLPDASCAILSGAACAASGGDFQGAGTDCLDVACPAETQQVVFELPLSPAGRTYIFDQFDTQDGTRALRRVTLEIVGEIGVAVAIENNSQVPMEGQFILVGSLFIQLDTLTTSFADDLITDPFELARSDGIPGSWLDFIDLGFINVSGTASNSTSDPATLAAFTGTGTIPGTLCAIGDFKVQSMTDSTTSVDDFSTLGLLRVIYEYDTIEPDTGACCFADESCVDLTLDECAAAAGVFQGDDTSCVDADCTIPGDDPDRVGCTEKGSLLVYSKVEIRWDAEGTLLQDTFLSLTNDFPGDVDVQFYFVNGDPPLPADPSTGERAHPGWNWVDNAFTLTANQPTYWSALTGEPAVGGVAPFIVLDPGFPPGRPALDGSGDRVLRGYVLAWAVSASGQEIRWNHLSGSGAIVAYADGAAAWEYGACAYQVVDAAVAHGAPTGTPGVLMLDGEEYAIAFGQLLMNFQAVGSSAFSGPRLVTSDTDLTLHPADVDLRQETTGPVTTKAKFDVWNQNEVKFSGAERCVTCWDETLLSMYGVPNHFLIQNLQTDHGKARIDGLESQVCDDFGVVSQDAALHGLAVRLLRIDGGAERAAAGVNLIGMGFEAAEIRYDVIGSPGEATMPPARPASRKR